MRRRSSGSGEDEDACKSVDVLRSTDKASGNTSTSRSSSSGSGSAEMTSARAPARTPRLEASGTSTSSARRSPVLSPANAPAQWSSSTAVSTSLTLDNGLPRTASKDAVDATARPRKRHDAHARGPWRCSSLTFLTCLCSVLLLYAVINSFFTRQLDPVGCAMSYMRPSFTRFADFNTEDTRFASKYSLYLYRERGVDEDIRVKGVPVLFIPGNAGSYKQIRPIAAEAANYFHEELRQSASDIAAGKRPLDIFTVDFNEELTAFNGQTLLDQAEYLNEAVAYILTLYHDPARSAREDGLPDPKSVIILGHSMGGVVARAMLRMPNYQENSINTIITLAAPHARAPISFDADLVHAYKNVNTFWRNSFLAESPASNPLKDITLVSVAGGGLDTTIASEFSSLTSLIPDTHGFTVFTSSIPRVWSGMDHLAIMWCDQLRKALARAIFDVVDVRRPSQTRAQPDRIAALRRRLLTGMEPVVHKAAPNQEATTLLNLEPRLTTFLSLGERLTLDGFGSRSKKAHVLPIPAHLDDGAIFTLLTDQTLTDSTKDATVGVFLCSVSTPSPNSSHVSDHRAAGGSYTVAGLSCKSAASDVSFLPASTNRSRNAFDDVPPFSHLQYHMSDLSGHQFMAVVDMATEVTPGWLMAEFATATESSITLSKGHHELLMNGLDVRLPAARPIMTELKIPEVHSTMFAYTFEIKRHRCEGETEHFAPLLRQYIQVPYESKYFVNVRSGNINIHGISPYMPPPLRGGGASEGLSLQLWTDPKCNSPIDVSLRVDVLGSAGKLVMRYRTVFAAFPLLVVAMALRKQFKVYDASGVFISFSHSLDQCLRTSLPMIFTALTFFAIALAKAAKNPWVGMLAEGSKTPRSVDFTVNDLMLGTPDPFFWFLVPLFGLVSVGICVVFNYAALFIIHSLSLVWRFIRRSPAAFSPNPTFNRLLTLAIFLVLLGTVIPYQFAYVVLTIVHLLTCVRALRIASENPTVIASHNFVNYTHSMFLLLLFILPINIPTLIVWVHNLAVQWFTPLSTQSNLAAILPYIFLVEALSTGHMLPRVTNRLRHFTNIFIFALALCAALFGVSYAYRLHHLANALCAWLFLIHVSSGQLSPARLLFPASRPNPSPGPNTGAAAAAAQRSTKKRP